MTYTFTGDYQGNRAVSNNTALVNYTIGDILQPNAVNDHEFEFGGGVREGFTGHGLDYALGSTKADSGGIVTNALPNGTHDRGFVFVQPEDDANGYFILFDEISEADAGSAHLVFHPNVGRRLVVADRMEYDNPVRQTRAGNDSAGLTLFFGTEPASIQFSRGIIATRGRQGVSCIVPEYYFNTYPVNPDGAQRMVTVLFPYDKDHAKAAMARVTGPGYTGAAMRQGGKVDVALESDGATVHTYEGVTFKARALFFRSRGGDYPSMYFTRGDRVR